MLGADLPGNILERPVEQSPRFRGFIGREQDCLA